MHNRFYINEKLTPELIGEYVSLSLILNHVKAFRMRKYDEIKLYDGYGTVYSGVIKYISKRDVTVEIISCKTALEYSPIKISMFLPFIASGSMDLMLSKICELEVQSIYPVIMQRSVKIKAKDISNKGKVERWSKISASAMILSGRNRMTIINNPMTLEESFSSCRFFDIKLIASANSKISLADYLNLNPNCAKARLEHSRSLLIAKFKQNLSTPAMAKRSILGAGSQTDDYTIPAAPFLKNEKGIVNIGCYIGPEGDFTEDELKMAENNGFIKVKLSDFIMSTFTASIFSASILSAYFFNDASITSNLPCKDI